MAGDTEKSPPHYASTMNQHIPFSTTLGIMNIKQMFSFPTTKAALNASFGTGKDADAVGSRQGNVLWGTNGVMITKVSETPLVRVDVTRYVAR
jgi:hypothetical protein